MDYADKLLSTPKSKRIPLPDRFMSPLRNSQVRLSLTPDANAFKRKAKLSPSAYSPTTSQERFSSSKFNLCSPLASCQSCEVFNSPRKSSIGKKSDGSAPYSPTSRERHLPTKPIVMVELDDIPSDFYLSPIDWSRKDVIAMAFTNSFCFINPKTMAMEAPPGTPEDILSVKFDQPGNNVFLGCDTGRGQVYDTLRYTPVAEYEIFEQSVLCSDWREDTILVGSRDGKYAIIDDRSGTISQTGTAHYEELCNIKFSLDSSIFATCSNDCSVKIWDQRNLEKPTCVFEEHEAAVKALSWSPLNKNIIATGGGTSDKTIKIWDITKGETQHSVQTGSQVCNLYWNENYNEIVSTHGFSQNHIALWKGNDLSSVASFHTHKERILYMAASPNGQSIATAACNDTLQIWKLFPQRYLSRSESILLLR